MQFEGGLVDFNRVFNTQTTLLNAQDQLATTRGNIDLQLIQVYKALGGGWVCFLDGCGMPRFETAAGRQRARCPAHQRDASASALRPHCCRRQAARNRRQVTRGPLT